MTMIVKLRLGVLCLCALLFVPVGAAQAETKRLHEAWEDALAGQEHVLTPQQFARLNNLAYQAAVVRVCDGFEIDAKKFREHLTEAAEPPHGGNLSDDEYKTHSTFVLIEFGTRYGLLIAEGNATKASFCEKAAALRKDADIGNVWE